MTKPREKTREELTAEIEDGKKKIRQFENREKVLRRKLSIVNNSTHFDISKSTLAWPALVGAGIFKATEVSVDRDLTCAQTERKNFVRQRKIVFTGKLIHDMSSCSSGWKS